MSSYTVLGVMSGTSLDGIDLALVNFKKQETWQFQLLEASTIPYPTTLVEQLKVTQNTTGLIAQELLVLEKDWCSFLANSIGNFLTEKEIAKGEIQFIASHGHTLYHQPHLGYTLQIGNGAILAARTGINTYSDFRTADIALGGQGAPLVPVGDKLLFSEYDACLNLGGFANISFMHREKPIAFDICAVNTVLNFLASKLGKEYDQGGKIAGQGTVDHTLLDKLNALAFYKKPAPKSLGMEWVVSDILPFFSKGSISPQDALATYSEHIATQISQVLGKYQAQKVLVTGGGAFNQHLIEGIQKHTNANIDIPDRSIINYKEAILFAFLGVLAHRKETNVLASITGASKDHVAGSFHLA